MAGKYALYLPYKVLDSLSSGNVTDSQFREFIMGLAEYDKSGVFPDSHTAGFTMMYELLKPDLDFAKAKYETTVEKRREAGKLGGAPEGNQNAVKNRGGGAPEGNQNAVGNRGGGAPQGNLNAKKEAPDDQEPETDDKKQTQTQAKQAKQAKQADNSSKYSVVSNQLPESSSEKPENADRGNYHETTTTFLCKCKQLGYNISRQAAEQISAGMDPAWLSGVFTYPEFINEQIMGKYPDKPHDEHQRLFVGAFKTWDEKLKDFPEWRERKKTEAAAQEERRRQEEAAGERRRKMEEARANTPTACGHCGSAMAPDGECGSCPSCGYTYFFDKGKAEWVFDKPMDLVTEFEKRIDQRHNQYKTGAIA